MHFVLEIKKIKNNLFIISLIQQNQKMYYLLNPKIEIFKKVNNSKFKDSKTIRSINQSIQPTYNMLNSKVEIFKNKVYNMFNPKVEILKKKQL